MVGDKRVRITSFRLGPRCQDEDSDALGLGTVFRGKPRWGRDGLTQGIGPLGAEAALAPPAGTPLPGRSCGPLGSSQGGGNTGGLLHPVRGGRQGREKMGSSDVTNTLKNFYGLDTSRGFTSPMRHILLLRYVVDEEIGWRSYNTYP